MNENDGTDQGPPAPGGPEFFEGNFRAIAAISSDAIISIDGAQRIIFFNEGAERIFGYSADEMLGETLERLLPQRARGTHGEHVEAFGAGDTPARRMAQRQRIAGIRKSGDEFPAEASISKIDIDGERIYTVVLRDVTEQRKAQQAQEFLARAGELLASTLDFESTLRSVAQLACSELADWCAIYIRDDDGEVRRLEAIHRDPEMQALVTEIGEVARDPRGSYVAREAIETGSVALFSEISDALIQTMAQSDAHLKLLRRLQLRSAVVAPLIARDHTLGAIGLFSASPGRFARDDVALIEDLARRAALAVDNARLYGQAQQAIRARDEVLSIVSHDIGTSLSAIFLGTKVVLRQVDPDEDRGLHRTVRTCRDAAQQIQRLIDDLLDVQRLEAGRLEPSREIEDVGTILAAATELLAPLAEEKAIRVETALRGSVPPVYADRDRVLQILSNLVGNAIKYSPEETEIVVSAEPRADAVVFAVRDRGPGIPPDELPRIFDRFWQARRQRRPGAGLGLSIAKGLVEAHGGELWIESEPGEGTSAFFTLPAADGRIGEAAPG